MEFNNLCDFINSEEDFLKCIYIHRSNKDIIEYCIIDNFKIKGCYNKMIFKIDNGIEFNRYEKKYKNDIINNFDMIEKLYLQYIKEVNNKIEKSFYTILKLNCLKINYGLSSKCKKEIAKYKKLECKVPIHEYIYNFITDNDCLKVYLFLIYYTYRLSKDKNEYFKIGIDKIKDTLLMSEVKVKEIINVLINNKLIYQNKVIQGKTFYYEYYILTYEEFLQNKNDSFIYDISNKNKNNDNKPIIIDIPLKEEYKNNPNMYYIIYEITDTTNGMKYIGKHKTNNINDGYMGSGRLLKQNQEIKGIDKFTKKILHLCKNDRHMAEMERMEIEKVKAYENDMYYNLKKE